MVRTATSTKSDLEFHYDAMGNRVCKIVKPRDGSAILTQDEWTYTYYVRDASGNVISVYDRNYDHPDSKFYDQFTLEESHLYGSSRVGIKSDTTTIASKQYSFVAFNGDGTFDTSSPLALTTVAASTTTFTHEMRRKSYELSNHLGNVLVTVSDARTATNNSGTVVAFSAVVISASDYYAFGSSMVGRTISGDYRYTFNGKETDSETDLQDYGFRIYNPQLGRFLSVDPISKDYPWYSPYHFAGCNPILFVDLDGLEPMVAGSQTGQTASDYDPNGVMRNWMWSGSHWSMIQYETPQVANRNFAPGFVGRFSPILFLGTIIRVVNYFETISVGTITWGSAHNSNDAVGSTCKGKRKLFTYDLEEIEILAGSTIKDRKISSPAKPDGYKLYGKVFKFVTKPNEYSPEDQPSDPYPWPTNDQSAPVISPGSRFIGGEQIWTTTELIEGQGPLAIKSWIVKDDQWFQVDPNKGVVLGMWNRTTGKLEPAVDDQSSNGETNTQGDNGNQNSVQQNVKDENKGAGDSTLQQKKGD